MLCAGVGGARYERLIPTQDPTVYTLGTSPSDAPAPGDIAIGVNEINPPHTLVLIVQAPVLDERYHWNGQMIDQEKFDEVVDSLRRTGEEMGLKVVTRTQGSILSGRQIGSLGVNFQPKQTTEEANRLLQDIQKRMNNTHFVDMLPLRSTGAKELIKGYLHVDSDNLKIVEPDGGIPFHIKKAMVYCPLLVLIFAEKICIFSFCVFMYFHQDMLPGNVHGNYTNANPFHP